ncbi:three-Cys-motif partner protein TcmP [Oxalobacteraceae bacterium OTU3CINTB1]|nr:three-Cys-motif partner protein TcmP [Oxalobacteraceae bacterium OTU3CINTB1]
MAQGKHYDWRNGPAELDAHSLTKHEVLVGYLIRYFEQRTLKSRAMDRFRLTLVDGFCGGGLYRIRGTSEMAWGSPIRMIKAVEEAEFAINRDRTKKLKLDVQYIFIDKDKHAINHLSKVLGEEGYGAQIGKSIHLICEEFGVAASATIASVSRHTPKAYRALFFLDQYGYMEVPAPLIKEIFTGLPNSEVVLTFHVSSFATYTNDEFTDHVSKALAIDIRTALRGQSVEDIKANDADWRRFIQGALYQALVKNCGAKFFTPFFIRGQGNGHGEYWLVHLAQHHRAQDVMKQVHWKFQNHFVHYGGAGLDMLSPQTMGFRQEFDGGFQFDDVARAATKISLVEQLAENIVARPGPLTIAELFSSTCNTSPATAEMYHDALAMLAAEKEIIITTQKGKRQRHSRYMGDSDLIERSGQVKLF